MINDDFLQAIIIFSLALNSSFSSSNIMSSNNQIWKFLIWAFYKNLWDYKTHEKSNENHQKNQQIFRENFPIKFEWPQWIFAPKPGVDGWTIILEIYISSND
jgi:hypothetical protein